MTALDRRYQIGKSAEHPTLSFTRAAATAAPQPRAQFEEAEAPPSAEKHAIWVVHGMGQQVPFETLDALAQGVLSGVEQLAASVQPLIQSYARFRKFPWINVYSKNDIISGNLKFYDVIPPGPAPPAVCNMPDLDAVVPLIGHVEYWSNDLVWDQLIQHIT